MLAVVAFSMSMIGTFLVRSGILTRVHAFAVDPERGTFILALARDLHRRRARPVRACAARRVKEGAPFELVSREGGLVVNNLLLSVILGIVLHRHALSAVRRGAERREALGRPALFQRGRRAAGACPRRRWSASGRCCAGGASGRPVLEAADGSRRCSASPRSPSRSSSRPGCASCRGSA